jgi:hypothetical protein
MITKDIYGKTLSNTFNSKIQSPSQFLKPKVLIDWLDSRHLSNVVVTTNDSHASNSQGNIGYFFSPKQSVNGIERQSYTWAVAGAKDVEGKVIRADGNWYAMPSSTDDNYEYGWWSGSVSESNSHPTYSGYRFTTSPNLTIDFDSRKCNLIRVVTSEFYGQIDTYQITVRSSDSGVPNPLYTEIAKIQDGSYYKDHYLPESIGHSTINRVEIIVYTTKNPEDYARIQEVNILYQQDMSDYVVDMSTNKTRDLHETSLPIAGSSSGSVNITLDNTDKDFNLLGTGSAYGQYMRKDLKVYVSTGWQIQKSNDQFIDKELRSNISSSDTTISLSNTDDLPDGGVGNEFVIILDPDSINREYVLVSSKSDTYNLNILQRGYNNSTARNHSLGTTVRFDTFEYPEFMEAYVDEWQGTTSSMTVSLSGMDWTKFMSERIVSKGFFLEKATVSDATENLLMITNFPKADINSLNLFDRTAVKNGGVVHFDFGESTRDRSNNEVTVSNGLRARFFAMPNSAYNKVKDITADAIDRQLTELEKALGEAPFTAPDFVDNTLNINLDNSFALDLDNFTFLNLSGETVGTYYNGVIDGFYIPVESGFIRLSFGISHGGMRVYVDDNLVLDEWRNHVTNPLTPETLQTDYMSMVAGRPYKLRIELFYTTSFVVGENLTLYMQYQKFGGSIQDVLAEDCKTICVLDKIGSRDADFNALTSGDPTPDRNRQSNYALYLGGGNLGVEGGLVSSSVNTACLLGDGKYVRLPYDLSWDVQNQNSNNYTGEWSLELYIKPAETFAGDGEYLSTWSNSSPTAGFEFFSTSGSNGFKLKTTSGTETVSDSSTLSTSSWSHIIVTFDGEDLKYYVNGLLKDEISIDGTINSWSNLDLTFGGRGASYVELTGETVPSTIRDIYFDEFVIYNKCLSSENVADRYTETQMQPLTLYPFLYGNEMSVREIIDQITLADLGRFYIDETNKAKYEHFYRFYEPTIDQHANTQLSISDSNAIIDADYNVQLQANRVVVKIAGLSSNLVGVQSLWRADDPTTLAVVNLEQSISNSSVSMFVSTTQDPPFFDAGYVVIDNEIIKYSSKTSNQLLNLERGMFGTTPTSHSSNTAVREARYWDITYDKAPAFQVKNPFITGILFEEPDQIDILKWLPGNYGAELIIAANANVEKGTFVFAEGTNVLTEKVAFTAISGIPVVINEQSSQIKEQVANLEENIRLYGLKEVVIENPFITSFNHGQKIADFIISKLSDPVPILNITTIPTPKLQVGDRIRISNMDAFDIINGDYWVVSRDFSYSSSPSQSLSLRKVS